MFSPAPHICIRKLYILSVFCFMATESLPTLKRKTRLSSGSETLSPDSKRVCETVAAEILSSTDDVNDTNTPVVLNMSEVIAQQLKQVLERLTSMEGKLDGVFEKVQSLESALSGVKSDVKELQTMTGKLKKATDVMDDGLSNLNTEVQELRKEIDENRKEIKAVNDRCLYHEVYNRRENLRFLGIPETNGAVENTTQVLYQFLERELELEGARDIEFQRVHRIGKKTAGVNRPIIARFLRFPDRERVFKRALELLDDIEVKVYSDLPKEIQDRRKKQWSKLKKAREEGKLAAFDRKEPDKLYIEGHLIPM